MAEAEIRAGAGSPTQQSSSSSSSSNNNNIEPTTETTHRESEEEDDNGDADELIVDAAADDTIFFSNFSSFLAARSTSEIEEVGEHIRPTDQLRRGGHYSDARLAPITEEEVSVLDNRPFSYGVNINGGGNNSDYRRGEEIEEEEEDAVYVVVDDKESSQSSMDALIWTLDEENARFFGSSSPSSSSSASPRVIYLVLVFPEVKFVPSPLGNGKVPRSQVRQDQVEKYLAEERRKRRRHLQKFIDACTARKVKAETILIESNDVAKAMLELLSVLNIQKLVIGVSKSNLRKLRSRKGNGVAVQILQNAPHWCRVKCICEGKDALEGQDAMTALGPPSPQRSDINSTDQPKSPASIVSDTRQHAENPQHRDSYLSYCCFKPNAANE